MTNSILLQMDRDRRDDLLTMLATAAIFIFGTSFLAGAALAHFIGA